MSERKRIIKVVIGKTAIDGHWRGIQAVASGLRDAGMEVVYAGSLAADALLQTAIQEDADIIGLHVGASYKQVEELLRMMRGRDLKGVRVILGGTIPLVDIPKLKELGVGEVFPPGSRISDIVKYIEENVRMIE